MPKVKNTFMHKAQIVVAVLLLLFVLSRFWVEEKEAVRQTLLLSADKKSILLNDEVVLGISDERVFQYFQKSSELCDESNIGNTTVRKKFCEDLLTFTSMTHFISATSSPDGSAVGFTIESDVLSPDTVAGIYYKEGNRVELLTNYYLGNAFLGFSPDGTHFVYKYGCFEGNCAFDIKKSETGESLVDFIPPYADARGNYEFVRWVSDNEFEYMFDNKLSKVTL